MKGLVINNRENSIFLILSLFIVFFWVFNDFGIRYIYGYAIMIILLIISLFVRGIILRTSKIIIWFSFLILFTFIFSVLPTSNFNDLTFALTVSMLVFWGYSLFASPGYGQIKFSFGIIKLAAFILSIYLIVTKVYPSVYWDNVYPHLSEMAQQEANMLVNDGYGIPIGASSTYADYVIMIAILIVFGELIYIIKKNNIKRILFSFLCLVIYFAAMLVENRRSEVLMMIVTLVILFFLVLKPRLQIDFSRKISLLIKVIILLVIAIVVCSQIGLLDRFSSTFDSLLNSSRTVNGVSSGRMDLWSSAWRLFTQNPVFGIGWEQFMTRNFYEHEVHNTYLQFLCETGVVGFVLLMIPIIAVLRLGIKQLRRFINYGSEYCYLKMISIVGVGVQLFFLLVNIIDPAFYHQNYFCFCSFSIILLNFCSNKEAEIKASNITEASLHNR